MSAAAATKAATRAETSEAIQQRYREARAQFRVRALELAFDRGLVGTARPVSENTWLGARQYRVPNRDRRGDGYVVSVVDGGDAPEREDDQRVICPCPAGKYGVACAHAGAVVHYERQRHSTGEASTAWDWWMAGGAW
ncbi:MAG TPA: hypothetical protein VF116_23465 [Ktedonobacterales bacterium]